MFACRLCGLQTETIPDDAVLIGKLHRFSNGDYHLFRKKPEPRTKAGVPRNPNREAPPPAMANTEVPPQTPEQPRSEPEREAPNAVQDKVITADTASMTRGVAPVLVGETLMERAFRRLVKV
jgi:hypothetical protein